MFAWQLKHSYFFKCWQYEWIYIDLKGKEHSGVATTLEAAKKQAAKHGYTGEIISHPGATYVLEAIW